MYFGFRTGELSLRAIEILKLVVRSWRRDGSNELGLVSLGRLLNIFLATFIITSCTRR